MAKKCYFNGKIVNLNKAKIDPYDLGMLRGYGVFDVMCTQNGKPFLLDEHWQRFVRSAKELAIEVPISKKKYQETIGKLLRLNGYKKSNIRTVLTGGWSHNGFAYKPGKETILILIEKFQALPDEIYKEGARVVTLDFERSFPRAKVTNYAAAIKNQKKKEKSKSLEIVYFKNGKALEASTSNFFVVKNNRLITTRDGILLGITRNLAVRLAKKARIKVEEREISEREFRNASEIFLTATNKDIVPVVRIDGKKVGTGRVGKNTQLLMRLFADFAKNY